MMGAFFWGVIGVILGVIVGLVLAQVRDRQRERSWQQQFDARVETIERSWQQQLDRDREQVVAAIAKLEALQSERAAILESHQQYLRTLEQDHRQQLQAKEQTHREEIAQLIAQNRQAQKSSLSTSRVVIKGKIAEQLAPFLPGFHYLPSDARFLGEPIDYVVFNGYSDLKEGQATGDDLEIVFLEVKTGSAKLTPRQRAISQAITARRVRFETIRIDTVTPPTPNNEPDQVLQQPSAINELPDDENVYPGDPNSIAEHPLYVRAYQPWFDEEDELLKLRYSQGFTVRAIAAELQREPGAIRSRLRKLGQT